MIPMLVNSFYEEQIRNSGYYNDLRHIIEPSEDEVCNQGFQDASGEAASTVMRGLQHKYRQTVLILTSNKCFSYCRFCFRRRLVDGNTAESIDDVEDAGRYIASDNEISDVHLSGGDPFVLSTEKLNKILDHILTIPHIRSIRFGTKAIVHNPARFDDRSITMMFQRIKQAGKVPVMITHIDHFGEISDHAKQVLHMFASLGVQLLNHAVLLRKVNDKPEILTETFRQIHGLGIKQYYLFQARPVCHASHFQVPLVEGIGIVNETQRRLSGVEKTFRFIMSHFEGKIEIMGVENDNLLYLKYHQCRDPFKTGRIITVPCSKNDCWIGDIKSL